MATREPLNLSLAKSQLREYVASGRYDRDMVAATREAKSWLEQRKARGGERLTVVFDLDETLWSNLPHMTAMDFGYVVGEWDRWVDAGNAPGISPVQEVYRVARACGMDVIFLTARRERDRPGTERNLRAIGCGDYAALICRAASDQRTTAEFKTEERRRLTREGRVIVANLGDQESDLTGGFAERVFKLPNPFYLTD